MLEMLTVTLDVTGGDMLLHNWYLLREMMCYRVQQLWRRSVAKHEPQLISISRPLEEFKLSRVGRAHESHVAALSHDDEPYLRLGIARRAVKCADGIFKSTTHG